MEESLSLTKEQQEILLTVKHMCVNEILKINAFAGTGKTSTLIAISRALPHQDNLRSTLRIRIGTQRLTN